MTSLLSFSLWSWAVERVTTGGGERRGGEGAGAGDEVGWEIGEGLDWIAVTVDWILATFWSRALNLALLEDDRLVRACSDFSSKELSFSTMTLVRFSVKVPSSLVRKEPRDLEKSPSFSKASEIFRTAIAV